MEKLKKINDDGWITSVIICVIGILITFIFGKINWYSLFGLTLGIIYEHVVEWFAHGWFQHYQNKIFKFFYWRHQRHHDDSSSHHALQPISILIPVIIVILFPFILIVGFFKNTLLVGFATGSIIGFLFAHIYLNLLHFDIHSKKKIFPAFFRKTSYFQKIYTEHINHHIEHKTGIIKSRYRVYSISNPWLDILLDKLGINAKVDKLYPLFIKFIEDKIYHGR